MNQVDLDSSPTLCLKPWQWAHVAWPAFIAASAVALIPFASTTYPYAHRFVAKLPLDSHFATANEYTSLTSIATAVLLIWILKPQVRRLLPYLIVALLLAGAFNTALKQLAGRCRPEWSVAINQKRIAQLEKTDPQIDAAIARTDRWFWFTANRPYFKDRYASFPSGHACGAFAMAAFLSILFPQARIIWYMAAVSCALARVRYDRHFPEDVMFGGALGWITAQWVFSWPWPMRMESWLRNMTSGRRPPELHLNAGRAGEETS